MQPLVQQVATRVNRQDPAVLEVFTFGAIIGSVKLPSIERFRYEQPLGTTSLRLNPPSNCSRLCNRNMTSEARRKSTPNDVQNCDQLHKVSAESQKLTMMIVVKQSLWKALADTSILHHYGDIDFWLEWDTPRGITEAFYRNFNCCLWKCIHGFAIFSAFFIFSSRQGCFETREGDKRDSECVCRVTRQRLRNLKNITQPSSV